MSQASLSSDPILRVGPADPLSPEDACKLLADPSTQVSALVLDERIPWPGFLPVLQEARKHRPLLPILLSYDKNSPLSAREAARLAITETVPRSQVDSRLGKLVEEVPLEMAFFAVADGEQPRAEGFVAVPILEFLAPVPSAFDVYLRMPSGKWLKILNARETLERGRVANYLKTGVRHLYVRQESVARCLQYCGQLQRGLLENNGISESFKLLNMAGFASSWLKNLPPDRLQDSHLDAAYGFVGDVICFVSRFKSRPAELAKLYLENASSFEHAVSVCFAVALLSARLDLHSRRLLVQLGVGALLHDIGFRELAPGLEHEDTSRMSSDEIALFLTHPVKSAEFLRGIAGMDEVVLQAVVQHHERRDGSGFPAGLLAGQIHLFGELLGLADELVRALRSIPSAIAPHAVREQLADRFSLAAMQVFDQAFPKTGTVSRP